MINNSAGWKLRANRLQPVGRLQQVKLSFWFIVWFISFCFFNTLHYICFRQDSSSSEWLTGVRVKSWLSVRKEGKPDTNNTPPDSGEVFMLQLKTHFCFMKLQRSQFIKKLNTLFVSYKRYYVVILTQTHSSRDKTRLICFESNKHFQLFVSRFTFRFFYWKFFLNLK